MYKKLEVSQYIEIRPTCDLWYPAQIINIGKNGEVNTCYGEGLYFSFIYEGWENDSQVRELGHE